MRYKARAEYKYDDAFAELTVHTDKGLKAATDIALIQLAMTHPGNPIEHISVTLEDEARGD